MPMLSFCLYTGLGQSVDTSSTGDIKSKEAEGSPTRTHTYYTEYAALTISLL
jgi:hypothetical protein